MKRIIITATVVEIVKTTKEVEFITNEEYLKKKNNEQIRNDIINRAKKFISNKKIDYIVNEYIVRDITFSHVD